MGKSSVIIQKISEAFKSSHQKTDWYIMKATRSLFGANKISIDRLEEIWPNDDNTVYAVETIPQYFSDQKPVKLFCVSSGEIGHQVGEVVTFTEDTGMGYGGQGQLKIENIIVCKGGVVVSSKNDVGIKEKRAVWVFK